MKTINKAYTEWWQATPNVNKSLLFGIILQFNGMFIGDLKLSFPNSFNSVFFIR